MHSRERDKESEVEAQPAGGRATDTQTKLTQLKLLQQQQQLLTVGQCGTVATQWGPFGQLMMQCAAGGNNQRPFAEREKDFLAFSFVKWKEEK